jgi:outer membrane protein
MLNQGQRVMKINTKRILLPLLWLAMPASVLADNMLSIYQQAVQSDPQLQAAKAAYQATLEVVPQNRAALLPNLGLTGDVSRNRYHNRSPSAGEPENSYATNKTFGAQLTQAIYQRENFLKLEQTDSVVAKAKAQLTASEQDLVLRVATAYFLVLGAQDNLTFVKGNKAAITRTLEQAKQRFDVGLSAITDVLEAQARYDTAVSDVINAEKLLADSKEALRELTGVEPGTLEILKPEIPLTTPDPAVEDKWVGIATDQNPLLLAARAATETARQEIDIQRAGHYPTVDLTAKYAWLNNNFGGTGFALEQNQSSIGVQMTLPLYQGGLVVANTRQSQYQFNQAQENQVKQRRSTERKARDYYRGVITGISKVDSLKQAVASNEKALEAAEAGFEVGTRTIVDVLNTQSDLLSAKRDYARSRYDYLLDMLRLKDAAGILDEEDLKLVNALLQ